MDLDNFTDVLGDNDDEIVNSQPLSLSLTPAAETPASQSRIDTRARNERPRPARGTGQQGEFRSVEEIDSKYRNVFSYPFFNLVQSSVLDDALYSDKSMVVCAPTGSGKTVVFEMAIVQLLMELDDKNYTGDFKIIYMAPVKALCSERLSEWYPKFTRLGLNCIEVTGDTNVDFSQLKPYRIIITTPEKWDMLTRRWRDNKSLVEVIKLFLIDEVHILNDDTRGPVLEAVVSRMKTIESSSQSAHRIEQLQKQYQTNCTTENNQISNNVSMPVQIRFVAVSATVSNPEDVAAWLGTRDKPAVYYKFGDECRPVKLKRIVEGYPCAEGTSIFKFDIILNYKLWPVIQKYHDGKPTLIFCNTRKSVAMTAEALSRELSVSLNPEQQGRLTALASTIKNKKLQALVLSGVGCHHAGLLYEERLNIEEAFRNRDLPILITTTTLAMGVNLPAHLVIIKNTQQYVNGAYQEYSISTVLQMVGRAGRPQFDTEATAVIMTRLQDKPRYQALVGGDEPLQSYLHKRLPENLNSEAALGTVCDVAQCVQWVRSTFLSVRAAKDPKRYLGLPQNAQPALISKKIEELCVKAMNSLASSGLITMDEASCIESTEAGRLMSVYYLDLETMKQIMKIEGTESLEKLLWIVCESHELADMHLRMDERRTLNTLNRNNAAATIRFPMKGKINTRQMKLSCIIQAILGCLPIPEPSLNQEAMKVMRIADRVCKCLVAYVTRPDLISNQPKSFTAVVNTLILAKCIEAHLWENSPYVSKQLKGIGPTFSTLLATAGKVNFTLLEESHPRDLERIMNKGAPAGNVLRKQVSLLPKYQLTATPIDEKRISIQLLLLNQHQLAENRDQLTAGDSHKCYVVIGDSENYLLLFTSFKDKDLISVYDGALTYEITRKHNFEHKILIHCISSNWVGIDVQCEYFFKNIEPPFLRGEAINPVPIQDTPRTTTKKQTSITDVYKERKRKSNDVDFAESKEKKKRDTALVEKFKVLKNSFEATSKELKEDLAKSAQMSNMIINRMKNPNQQSNLNEMITKPLDNNFIHPAAACNIVNIDDDGSFYDSKGVSVDHANDYPVIDTIDLNDDDDFMVDDRINSIMNEIETDILKSNNSPRICANTPVKTTPNVVQKNELNVESISFIKPTPRYSGNNSQSAYNIPKLDTFLKASKSSNERRRKPINCKTNYSFIDTIEKSVELDNDFNVPQKDGGFSDTIKTQIEKFLQSTAKTKQHDIAIRGLLSCAEPIENISSSQTTPKTKTECSSTEHNTPLPSDFPTFSADYDNIGNAAQNRVIAPPELNKDTNKNKEDVTNERPIDTKLQNIDKIVEDIERDYKNIATKDSNCKYENTSTSVNNMYDTKSEENISDYLNNVNHDRQDSNKFKTEYCNEDINYNTSISNIDTIKTQAVEKSESLADNAINIITNNSVVPLMKVPNTLDNKDNEFKESLLKLYSIIRPTDLLLEDKYSTNDICNSHLHSITQNHPFTSKKPQNSQLQNRNQNDDQNRKDLNNMLVPELPKGNSSQITCQSYLNNFTHNDNRASEDTTENENNDKNRNTVLVPIPNENTSQITCKSYPNKFTGNDYRASEDTTKKENNNKNRNNMLVTIPNDSTSQMTCKSYPNNFTDNDYRASEDTTENENNIKNRKTMLVPIPDDSTSQMTCKSYPNNFTDNDYRAAEDTTGNDKTNNHIKRYSFSATKIDVSMKNMPDHKVQIIRKLKLDVDVTEIVSKGRNRETTNKSEFSEDNTYFQIHDSESGQPKLQEKRYAASIDTDNILQRINDELPVKDDKIHRQYSTQKAIVNSDTSRPLIHMLPANNSSLKSRDISNIDESIPTNTCVDKEYPHSTQTNRFLTNAKNHLPLVTQSSLSNKAVETKEINEKTNFGNNVEDNELIKNVETPTTQRIEIQEKRKEIEDIEQYKKYLREIAGENDDIHKSSKYVSPETEQKNTPQEINLATDRINTENIEQCNEANAKSNKIDNILHKYSAILRKNNLYNNTGKNTHDDDHDVMRPPLEKTKKIYKISDIHKVNIPLPKNLITVEATRTPKPANECTVPRLDDEKYEDSINIPRQNENLPNETITEFKTIECFEDKLPEIIPEYHSPDVGNSQEHSTDFDLDQSMLNPKLLLEQCFSKDESNVILPPPTEFCDDENSYSPVKLEDSFQEYNETEQGDISHCDHDKSIFEEDNNAVLTPSVEIETWTLSREEDNKYNSNYSGLKHAQYNRASQKNENTDYCNSQVFHRNSYNANKSCTVLRRNNVSKDLSPSQDFEINSRQGKLGYFKFTHKKKFKM